MDLFKTIFQRTAETHNSSQDDARRPSYMLRGSLMGFVLLPAYFASTLSLPSANQVFPALAGMAILTISGAVVGYSFGNLAGFFDFSKPDGFLINPVTAPALSSAKHDELRGFDWDRPQQADHLDPRRWDDNELKMRCIVSGDWRDEYSTPSSREEDARRNGFF